MEQELLPRTSPGVAHIPIYALDVDGITQEWSYFFPALAFPALCASDAGASRVEITVLAVVSLN